MADKLTPKQEAFVLAYVESGSASDAYRKAYAAGGMTAKSIHETASRLLADPKIASRVAQLQAAAADRAVLTLEKHMDDLKQLRNAAVKAGKWSAAISAEIARGKAAGLYVDRTEVTGANGGPIPVASVPVEEYLRAREQALKMF